MLTYINSRLSNGSTSGFISRTTNKPTITNTIIKTSKITTLAQIIFVYYLLEKLNTIAVTIFKYFI